MSQSSSKYRTLFLLVMLQVVVGPLVLLQVSVFCSLTVREVACQGVTKALVKAWKSDTFQSLFNACDADSVQKRQGSLPSDDGKVGQTKVKIQLLTWLPTAVPPSPPATLGDWQYEGRSWTPAWPQAPPGTPPRAA